MHRGGSLHGIGLGSGIGVGELRVLLGSSEMLAKGTRPYREPMLRGEIGSVPATRSCSGAQHSPRLLPKSSKTLRAAPTSSIGLIPALQGLHPTQPQVGTEPHRALLLLVRGHPSDSCRPSAAARAASPLSWVFSPGISHRLSSQPCQRSQPRTRAQPRLLLRYHQIKPPCLGRDGDRDTGWALLPSSPRVALILLWQRALRSRKTTPGRLRSPSWPPQQAGQDGDTRRRLPPPRAVPHPGCSGAGAASQRGCAGGRATNLPPASACPGRAGPAWVRPHPSVQGRPDPVPAAPAASALCIAAASCLHGSSARVPGPSLPARCPHGGRDPLRCQRLRRRAAAALSTERGARKDGDAQGDWQLWDQPKDMPASAWARAETNFTVALCKILRSSSPAALGGG